ncbi:aspartate--tRNA ligase [Candidatus Woesearchaeota archaeon]|jgi:aspartyl-tRNA synthetase|nr:aspartate--tRNA ligase [Candidatus Woesearchaeota archaeon]
MKYRTHTCGGLTKKEVGKKAILSGFVESIRTHGKIGFINLRDRYGVTQVFLGKEFSEELAKLTRESVVRVEGEVKKRPDANKKLKTGEIEVSAKKFEILNLAPELPLELDESDIKSTEETRLKYRYLDLRKPRMQENLLIRHKIIKAIRDFLDKEEFYEVETPLLAKSTPEGARDYLVPSRIHKGKLFALPQSPQLFKQLLMVAGLDKYFQIAKCMRDEDLRADRQPEFTQLDLEMSFVEEEEVYRLFEKMLKFVWKQVFNENLKIPFERITYEESMKKYKSDKPDLRKKGEKFKFAWVTEFPLFEWSEEQKRHVSCHHPFTGIHPEDIEKLGKTHEIRSRSYDLVLNGWELGSGSVRIHDGNLQSKIFETLKLTEKEAKEKFGFFLDALKFAPPHAGFAIGLDRLVALVCNAESIREVIAFPKNKDAKDLMLDSPSKVDKKQLDDVGLKLK